MIGLIKNELVKLFKNRAFYICLFLIFLFPVLDNFFGSVATHTVHSYNQLTKEYKYVAEHLGESSSYHIDKVYKYQLLNDGKLFKDNYKKSLQLICNDYFANKMYISKGDNNTELYNYFKAKYDLVYKTIEDNDLDDSISKIKDIFITTLEENKAMYEVEENNYNKEIIQSRIDYLNNFISNYDYIIKYKNLLNNDDLDKFTSLMYNVNRLYIYDVSLDEINDDNYRYVSAYKITKYKLDNNQIFLSYFDEYALLSMNYSYSSLTDLCADNSLNISNIFIIFIVCISIGSIIASEFEKNTVKQLLIRPFSRTKILISKILASFIYVTILAMINCLASYLVFGIVRGFDFDPIILLHLEKGIVVYNPIVFYLKDVICLLPFLYIYTMILFLFSELTKNTLGTNMLVFVIWFFNFMLTSFVKDYHLPGYKLLKFLPLSNCDIKTFVFLGGKVVYKQNLLVCIISWIIFMAVLYFITNNMFKKDEIKNLEK